VSSKVYAGNLPWSIGETELQQLFEPFGEVTSAAVVIDLRTGRSRGFGFVQMESAEAAARAIAALHGMHWQGRPLKVSIAREKPDIGGRQSP
jgi:RNA recognition motif-containing protein